MAPEVLLPRTPAEAIEAFGDGSGVTVVGGGTIVLPEVTHGRLSPARVLLLSRSGLAGVRRSDGAVTIGAATPVGELAGGDEPLASVAAHVADPEIRAQATVAGNLCAGPGAETPRGDLQAPLLALDARVRWIGQGGEQTGDVEAFLAGDAPRLVLDVSYDDVDRQAGYASVHRPHAHHYTILTVCAVRTPGATRVAVGGAGPVAVRARSVEEALGRGEAPPAAARRVLDDVEPADDALASAWYRRRVLPTLVGRALAALDGVGSSNGSTSGSTAGSASFGRAFAAKREKVVVNGREHAVESPPLTPLLAVLREELGVTSPKAGCQQGGCGACTVLVDGDPRRACLTPLAALDGAEVTTVEGLGSPEALSTVQAAFHEHYAAQCGYCTSGMMLAAQGLLGRNPSPTRDEIASALSGHVCRCTGYVKIVEAVEAAASGGGRA